MRAAVRSRTEVIYRLREEERRPFKRAADRLPPLFYQPAPPAQGQVRDFDALLAGERAIGALFLHAV
jgi:hypothetical protein